MMESMDGLQLLALGARLLLAGVFAIAAIGKLRDRDASARAISAFGLPPGSAPPVAVALPVAELAVAGGLLVATSAAWAAAAAIALLAVFSALVGRSLRRGRRPTCNCFGSAHGAPIGATTLVRNGVLLLIAGYVVIRRLHARSTDGIGEYGDLTSAQAVALVVLALVAAALAVQGWSIVGLIRQNGRLLERLAALEEQPPGSATGSAGRSHLRQHAHHRRPPRPGPAVGSPAPRFALDTVDGERASIDDVLDDTRPTVLIFLEPGCAACEAIAESIAEDAARGVSASDRAIVGVAAGDADEVRSTFRPAGFAHLLVDRGAHVADQYGVAGTPSAVVVLPDGRIGSALAEGRAASERLVRRSAPRRAAGALPHPELQEPQH